MNTFGGGGGGMGPTATPSLGRGPKVTAPRPVKIAAVSLIDLKEQAAKTPTPARGWAVVPQPPAAPLPGVADLGVSSALFPPVSASKQQLLTSSQNGGKSAVGGAGSGQTGGSGGRPASRDGKDGRDKAPAVSQNEKKEDIQSDGNVSQGNERKGQEGSADGVAGRAGNKPSTVETDGATLGGFAPSPSAASTGAPQGEEDSKAVGAGAAGMSLSKLITSTKKVGISVSVRGRAVNTAAGTVKPSGSAWKSGVSGASTSAPSANASSSAQPTFLNAGSATNAVTGSVDEEAFPDLMKSAEQVKLEAQKEKDRQKRAKEALRRVEQQKAEGGGQRRLGLQELFELGESATAADGTGATGSVPSRPATTQRRWADEEPEEEEDFLQGNAGETSELGGFGRSGFYGGCGASPLPQYVMPGMQGSLVAGYLSFMAVGRRDPPPEPPQEPYPYHHMRGDGAAGSQPAPPSVPPPGGVRGGAFGHTLPSWAGADSMYQQNTLLHERSWRQTSEQAQQSGNTAFQRPQLLQRRGEGLVSAPPRPYLFAGAGADGVMEIDMEKQRELMRVKAEQKRREEEQREREQKERAIRKLQELDARLAKEQGTPAPSAPVPPPADVQHAGASVSDSAGRGESKNARDRGRSAVIMEEEDWRRPTNGVTPERLPRASSAQPRTAVDPNMGGGSVARGQFAANNGGQQQNRPPPPPPAGGHGGSRGIDRRGPGNASAVSKQGASLLGAGNAQSGILPGHSVPNNIIEHEGTARGGGSSLIHGGAQAQPPPPPSESLETWRTGRGDAAHRGRSAAGGVSSTATPSPTDVQGLPPLIRGGRGGSVRQQQQHQQSPLLSGQAGGESSTGGESAERPRYRFGALVNKHLEERHKEEEEHSQQPSGRHLSTRVSNRSSRSPSAHKRGAEAVPAIEGTWRQSPGPSSSSSSGAAAASGRAASAGPPSAEGQRRTEGEGSHHKHESEKQQRPSTATVRTISPARDSAEQAGAQKPLPRGMLPLPNLRGGNSGSSQHGGRSSPLPQGRHGLGSASNTSESTEGKGKSKHPPQTGVHSGNWRASGNTSLAVTAQEEGGEGGTAAVGASKGRINGVEDGADQGPQASSNSNSSRREGEDHGVSKGGRSQQPGHSGADSGDTAPHQSQNSVQRPSNTSAPQSQFHTMSGGSAQAASQKPPLIAAAPLLPYGPGSPELKGSNYSQQMAGGSGSKQQNQQQSGTPHGTGATGKSVKDLHKNATLWQLSSASFPSAPAAPKSNESGGAGQRAGLLKKPGRGEGGQRGGGSSTQSSGPIPRLGNGGGGDLSFKALLATRPAPAVLVATHTKADEVQGGANSGGGSQQSGSATPGQKDSHGLSSAPGGHGQANAQQPGRDRPTSDNAKTGAGGRRGLNQRGRGEGETASSVGNGHTESTRGGQDQRHDGLRGENMRAGHTGGQQQHGEGESKEGKDTTGKGQGRKGGNGSQGQRAWATVEKPPKKISEDNDTWPQSESNAADGKGSGGAQLSSRKNNTGTGTGEQVPQGSSNRDDREAAFRWGAGSAEPAGHAADASAVDNVAEDKASISVAGDDSSRSERRLSGSAPGSGHGSGSKGNTEPLFTRRSGAGSGRGGRHTERVYAEREATGAAARGGQQQNSAMQSRPFDARGRDQQQAIRGGGRGGGRGGKSGGSAATDEAGSSGNHHQKRVLTADAELGWSRQAPTTKGASPSADVSSQQQASQSGGKGGPRKSGGEGSVSGGSAGGRGQGNRGTGGPQGPRSSPGQASTVEANASGLSSSCGVQAGSGVTPKVPDAAGAGSSSSGNASPSCAGGGRGSAGARGPTGSGGAAAVWLPKGATKKVRDDSGVAPAVAEAGENEAGGSSGGLSQIGGAPRPHGKAPSNSPKGASAFANNAGSGGGGGPGKSRARTGSAGPGPVTTPDHGVPQSQRGQESRGGVSSSTSRGSGSRGSTGGSKGQFGGNRGGEHSSQGMADEPSGRADGCSSSVANQHSENEQMAAAPDEEGFQLVKSKRREQQEKRKRVEQQKGSEKGAQSRNRKNGQQSTAWTPSAQSNSPDENNVSSTPGPAGRNGSVQQTGPTSGSGASKRGAQGGRNTSASPTEEGKGGHHHRGQGAGGGGAVSTRSSQAGRGAKEPSVGKPELAEKKRGPKKDQSSCALSTATTVEIATGSSENPSVHEDHKNESASSETEKLDGSGLLPFPGGASSRCNGRGGARQFARASKSGYEVEPTSGGTVSGSEGLVSYRADKPEDDRQVPLGQENAEREGSAVGPNYGAKDQREAVSFGSRMSSPSNSLAGTADPWYASQRGQMKTFTPTGELESQGSAQPKGSARQHQSAGVTGGVPSAGAAASPSSGAAGYSLWSSNFSQPVASSRVAPDTIAAIWARDAGCSAGGAAQRSGGPAGHRADGGEMNTTLGAPHMAVGVTMPASGQRQHQPFPCPPQQTLLGPPLHFPQQVHPALHQQSQSTALLSSEAMSRSSHQPQMMQNTRAQQQMLSQSQVVQQNNQRSSATPGALPPSSQPAQGPGGSVGSIFSQQSQHTFGGSSTGAPRMPQPRGNIGQGGKTDLGGTAPPLLPSTGALGGAQVPRMDMYDSRGVPSGAPFQPAGGAVPYGMHDQMLSGFQQQQGSMGLGSHDSQVVWGAPSPGGGMPMGGDPLMRQGVHSHRSDVMAGQQQGFSGYLPPQQPRNGTQQFGVLGAGSGPAGTPGGEFYL